MSTVEVGQEFLVSLQGIDVAVGTVEYIEGNEVTIIIPQTRVVMGLSNTLAPLETVPTVDRVPAQLPDDSTGDGGAPAREAVRTEEVPPYEDHGRNAGTNLAEHMGDVPLKQQNLDSSILD